MKTMRNSSKLKVVALQRESLVAFGVPSLSVAARVTEVLDYLSANDEVDYVAISESDPCAINGIKWADVLILSKHNSSNALNLTKLASNRGIGIIYDIDDWIFSFPKYSGGRTTSDRTLTRNIIGFADVVTVANEELCSRLAHVLPDVSPILLPNGMWVERHSQASNSCGKEANSPRIVFTNADFLKVQKARDGILTALQVFFARHPEYVLDFFGDPFPEMFSLPFLHFTNRIPYDAYMRSLVAGGYQFSITPLGANEDEDSTEFNSCKNPFKYINYGTAKVPGIYSKADIYIKSVQSGITGLLVDNTFDSWLEALELMAGNKLLRDSIRAAAYKDVMEKFHVNKSSAVLKTIFENLQVSRMKKYANNS